MNGVSSMSSVSSPWTLTAGAPASGAADARIRRCRRARRRRRRSSRSTRRWCSAGEARTLKKSLAGSPRVVPSCCRAVTVPRASPNSRLLTSATPSRVLLQMAVVLTPRRRPPPIVKLGRMAGQFAKPRSAPVETARRRDAAELPRRQRQRFTAAARSILCGAGLLQSAATMNLVRAPSRRAAGPPTCNRSTAGRRTSSPPVRGDRYRGSDHIRPHAEVHGGLRLNGDNTPQIRGRRLHLARSPAAFGYEQALRPGATARPATGTTARRTCCVGSASACASPMARTSRVYPRHRQSAGVKVGPEDEARRRALRLCDLLNPANEAGRDADRAHGRADTVGDALPLVRAGAGRAQGGLVPRPDARQHDHVEHRLKTRRSRRVARRGARLLRRTPRRGRTHTAACTSR